jgi:hypothetical protein
MSVVATVLLKKFLSKTYD